METYFLACRLAGAAEAAPEEAPEVASEEAADSIEASSGSPQRAQQLAVRLPGRGPFSRRFRLFPSPAFHHARSLRVAAAPGSFSVFGARALAGHLRWRRGGG